MKVLKIGRDEDCDIRISDEENRISRVHAFLRIYPFGSIEIIDNSKNGTKVGGNPISYGQPYPVKRNETINFADVRRLDWSLVPNPRKRIAAIAASLVTILVVIIAVGMALNLRGNTDDDYGFDTQITDSEQPSQQSAIAQPTTPTRPVTGSGVDNNTGNGILVDEDGRRIYEGIRADSKDSEDTNGGTESKDRGKTSGKKDGKSGGKTGGKGTGKDSGSGKDKEKNTDKNEGTGDGISEIL